MMYDTDTSHGSPAEDIFDHAVEHTSSPSSYDEVGLCKRMISD